MLPLGVASQYGHDSTVATLLALGADPNQISPNGESALCIACAEGHTAIVRRLLDHGAAVHRPHEATGMMPALHTAAGAGHVAVVELLIARGANVLETYMGSTPLSVAIGEEQEAVIPVLVDEEERCRRWSSARAAWVGAVIRVCRRVDAE